MTILKRTLVLASLALGLLVMYQAAHAAADQDAGNHADDEGTIIQIGPDRPADPGLRRRSGPA